jgi:hypothetical protein
MTEALVRDRPQIDDPEELDRVVHRVRPERTHDIGEAVEQLSDSFVLKGRFLALDRFTDYAIAFRCPGALRPTIPSSAEIDVWTEQIEVLKADFEDWLKERTGGKSRGCAR